MDLEQIRRDYLAGGLRRNNLDDNPFAQFKSWLKQAVDGGMVDPTAMVVATVDEAGFPNQRIVLLKHVDEDGFVFYTNYGSAKGQELAHSGKVCLHFPWHSMERQVRVRGTCQKIGHAESVKYFHSRPRESQIAAWASQQSSRIESRAALMAQFATIEEKYKNTDVPLPNFWGGFRVTPSYFEFWQGRSNRLHDRFEYKLVNNNQWDIGRLAP